MQCMVQCTYQGSQVRFFFKKYYDEFLPQEIVFILATSADPAWLNATFLLFAKASVCDRVDVYLAKTISKNGCRLNRVNA